MFGGSYPHTPFNKGGRGVPSMLHMSVQTLCLKTGRWGGHVGAFLKQISCLSANSTEMSNFTTLRMFRQTDLR